MDLKDLKEPDPIDVAVVHDEEGKPTHGFKAHGADSPQYQQAIRTWQQLNVKKAARRGRNFEMKTEAGVAEVIDVIKGREFAVAEACIFEIYGFTKDGGPAPVDHETLTMIFTARPTWLNKVVFAIERDVLFTMS